MATPTSDPCKRRRVVYSIAGYGDDAVVGTGGSNQPSFLSRRRASDNVHRRKLGGKSCVVPAGELFAGDDSVGVEARVTCDCSGGEWVIARYNDDLDAGATCRLQRVADAGTNWVGEADQGMHLPLTIVAPAGKSEEAFTARGARFD